MAKPDPKLGMQFIQVVPLEPGVLEFTAWEKALWLWIWEKPWQEKVSIPHLVYLDCPGGTQQIWRMLVLEGQAEMPVDEKEYWSPIQLGWRTRRSFCTLWMSSLCMQRGKVTDEKRGSLVAKEVKPVAVGRSGMAPPVEQESYAP